MASRGPRRAERRLGAGDGQATDGPILGWRRPSVRRRRPSGCRPTPGRLRLQPPAQGRGRSSSPGARCPGLTTGPPRTAARSPAGPGRSADRPARTGRREPGPGPRRYGPAGRTARRPEPGPDRRPRPPRDGRTRPRRRGDGLWTAPTGRSPAAPEWSAASGPPGPARPSGNRPGCPERRTRRRE